MKKPRKTKPGISDYFKLIYKPTFKLTVAECINCGLSISGTDPQITCNEMLKIHKKHN